MSGIPTTLLLDRRGGVITKGSHQRVQQELARLLADEGVLPFVQRTDPQGVAEQPTHASSVSHRGRVLHVQEGDFVIVSLGSAHDVYEGTVFRILRDSRAIGTVSATMVQQFKTACKIISQQETLRVGDVAIMR